MKEHRVSELFSQEHRKTWTFSKSLALEVDLWQVYVRQIFSNLHVWNTWKKLDSIPVFTLCSSFRHCSRYSKVSDRPGYDPGPPVGRCAHTKAVSYVRSYGSSWGHLSCEYSNTKSSKSYGILLILKFVVCHQKMPKGELWLVFVLISIGGKNSTLLLLLRAKRNPNTWLAVNATFPRFAPAACIRVLFISCMVWHQFCVFTSSCGSFFPLFSVVMIGQMWCLY